MTLASETDKTHAGLLCFVQKHITTKLSHCQQNYTGKKQNDEVISLAVLLEKGDL